jgi:hypothetical protein
MEEMGSVEEQADGAPTEPDGGAGISALVVRRHRARER